MLGENPKIKSEYGLTQSQLSMWTGQMLNPEIPLYNMVYTFEFEGIIDAVHFQRAFHALIGMSDALRTIFVESGGATRQIILSKLNYELEFLDWSNKGLTSDELERRLEERSGQMLDLSKCIFDSALIKLGKSRFIWYFNKHHLATDARASSIIYKKMSELYTKSLLGRLAEVSPFPSLANYLSFEKRNPQNTDLKKKDDYWRKKAESVSGFPKLYGREVGESATRSRRVTIDLGVERTKALCNLTGEKDLRSFTKDLSLFNIFSTVLLSYLYRVSGQNELAFGTPVHNRSTPEFKETPGLFIEFFPFVCEVKNGETFSALFERVSRETFEFLRNARPGASSATTNRAFNVVLNYINTDFPDFAGNQCIATWRHPNHSDPRHYMRLHVYNEESKESLRLFFDLNIEIFTTRHLEDAPNHFLKLLDAFIDDREQLISERSLLNEDEVREIVFDINEQAEDKSETVLELFRKQVDQTPNAIAIIDNDRRLNFSELNKNSNQLSDYLVSNGLVNGDQVSLYLSRSADMLVAILAVLKAGCAYVPIAINNPKEKVKEKIEISGSSMILTYGEFADSLGDIQTPLVQLDKEQNEVEKYDSEDKNYSVIPDALAYIMFTSGSTGIPKGVGISHRALGNYIRSAAEEYATAKAPVFPFFTAIDFDLTITSIFLPLVVGGTLRVYKEEKIGPDLAILNVIEDNAVDVIKLTPSHLALIKDKDLANSRIKTMIVGGEDFKTELARKIAESFPDDLKIYNEYGPTEATVGCILHRFDSERDVTVSVPIGKPFANAKVYVLDTSLNPVPQGVSGNLFLSGVGLSDGYWDNTQLTKRKFVANPFESETIMYDTGDLARLNSSGEFEYLGRQDQQVKIGGIRVEMGEIENSIASYPGLENCVVEILANSNINSDEHVANCVQCGLPSSYPGADFDEKGICGLCNSFESYQKRAQRYFQTPDDLKRVFESSQHIRQDGYNCILLLSGGKDSTFALAKLVEMGVNVLAFTLDNGYISDGAKANISRVTEELGVDHVFGETNAMNEIFVDSLKRHKNVCNGCFKTIYTLSIKEALERGIPFIVTGLSRGQFFETRLTEELFWKDDIDSIDQTILEARKAYHRVGDAVKTNLDTSFLADESAFEKVKFLDFYRYFDVELEDLMKYLDKKLPWIRPTDTGRSTNCLINQVGIYVHKKEVGYSNYAFPYSWDVRMGHKTREVSLDEINEEVDESEVRRIMDEIGFISNDKGGPEKMIAYYTALGEVRQTELRNHLELKLPAYMIPSDFIRLEMMPLTENGKIDRKAIRNLAAADPKSAYAPPRTEFEELMAEIWTEVLRADKIGIHDNFLRIGGHSLAAIRIMTRANEAFQLELQLNTIFEEPTIAGLAKTFENTILQKLEALK